MRVSPVFLVAPLIGACSLDRALPGSADVVGQVVQSSGLPLPNSSVAIDCGAGATRTNVPTDSTGRYTVGLSAPEPGRIRCLFGVPDLVTPRIRVDTVIGFSPVGQLHPLQIIDIRESTGP
jgi:hypothetical protein